MTIERVELAEVDLPEFGVPAVQPTIPASTYDARIAAALQSSAAAGHDVLIVYGDREHFANMAYLTGFDPRFEEALLILVPKRTPTLVVGVECMGYSVVSPVQLNRVLYQSFSLLSMPRGDSPPLETILRNAGVAGGSRVGMVGWKYYLPSESPTPEQWMEVPSYIVDTLRGMGAEVRNATAIFMNPESGLRATNDLDQLAYFEFSSTHGSQGVRNVLFNLRPGMTDFEAAQLMQMNGLPMAYHPLVEGGPRALTGLASASGRVLAVGDPMMAAYGPWGSNTARAGYLTADADSLPPAIRDTMDKLIKPYFMAIAAWYEHIGIGVPGGELWEAVHQHVGDPFFNVVLNPGHLIHLDEWLSSPIYRDSTLQLHSGMAIQVDVIPATGTTYHMIIIEDTIALADASLRAAFAERYPDAWSRIQRRRAFMQDILHIKLKPEVLPFSNIPAYAPPFWLSPRHTMRVG
jgi:hypothetical protein